MNTITYSQQLNDYKNQLKAMNELNTSSQQPIEKKASLNEFGNLVTQALDKLNTPMQKMDEETVKMISGDENDLAKAMISMTEAQLSLQTAVQVRNKCLDAYNEIKNMQF
ncbi:MAG TPA: flagellar hook-basal body complex protein FliE [Candidatus Tetragenococcus pullicola]|nr:flagellar hook-basal body complex protein FliE [Candidatus Tetragenococcus pullicola]